MTISQNLHLAFQFDTATAAIERVEFTAEAEDKVEQSAETAGCRARGGRTASQFTLEVSDERA